MFPLLFGNFVSDLVHQFKIMGIAMSAADVNLTVSKVKWMRLVRRNYVYGGD